LREKLIWFKILPIQIAFRFYLLHGLRKILGIDCSFIYSQTGEDVIIKSIFGDSIGFYLDIGCNEPIRLSNTFSLYLQGWKGICVDANSEITTRFKKIRKRDTVINAALSDIVEQVTFFKSETNAVSTINVDTFHSWKDKWEFKPDNTEIITTRTLNSILLEYKHLYKMIDLLSIDVEGHDYNVLKGLNLNLFRPKLIVVEIHNFIIDSPTDSEIYVYLNDNNYNLIGYITMNAYFFDKNLAPTSLNE